MWPSELDYLVQASRYAEFRREAEQARLLRSLPRHPSITSKVWATIRQWLASWRAAASTAQPVQQTKQAKILQT